MCRQKKKENRQIKKKKHRVAIIRRSVEVLSFLIRYVCSRYVEEKQQQFSQGSQSQPKQEKLVESSKIYNKNVLNYPQTKWKQQQQEKKIHPNTCIKVLKSYKKKMALKILQKHLWSK